MSAVLIPSIYPDKEYLKGLIGYVLKDDPEYLKGLIKSLFNEEVNYHQLKHGGFLVHSSDFCLQVPRLIPCVPQVSD